MVKSCSSKSAIKFLNSLIESDGVPKSIKVDNATAFKSTEFKAYSAKLNLVVNYSTPYVHTPIGLVERNIRTLEDYVKTFLIENNDLKGAVKRAVKTIRFSWSASLDKTPFECYMGRKPRTVLSNICDLENKGKDLVENVYDKSGNHLTQIHYTAKHLRDMDKDRKYGRSARTEDLQKEIRKRKVSSQRYFVVRNRNKKNLASKFETRIRPIISETEHTVFDGKKVFHKKDVAEVDNTVKLNRDRLQAKEIADRVEQKEKSVKRGDGGRFVNMSSNKKAETVAAKGGRKTEEDSDDSDEPLANQAKRRKVRKGTSSATRTGVTPPQTPTKRRSFGKTTVNVSTVPPADQQTSELNSTNNSVQSTDSSMDTLPSSDNSPTKATVPGASLMSTAHNQIQPYSPTKLEEYLKKLRNEPATKSQYGNDQTFKADHSTELAPESATDRPKRTRKAPDRFGLGLSH